MQLIEQATWEQLRQTVKEFFGVDMVDSDDHFSLEELFDVLRDQGLDPCWYQRGKLVRVHAHRAANWWSDDTDICAAGAKAALAWYFSSHGHNARPLNGGE
jgi:hypothetical protein